MGMQEGGNGRIWDGCDSGDGRRWEASGVIGRGDGRKGDVKGGKLGN